MVNIYFLKCLLHIWLTVQELHLIITVFLWIMRKWYGNDVEVLCCKSVLILELIQSEEENLHDCYLIKKIRYMCLDLRRSGRASF